MLACCMMHVVVLIKHGLGLNVLIFLSGDIDIIIHPNLISYSLPRSVDI